MENTAVTEQNSAPADVVEFETYQAEANERDLARRRGEAPKTEDSATSQENEEQKTTEENAAASEDSATSEKKDDTSDNAAASEAATHEQKDGKENGKDNANAKREKTAATSESRWAKITRENRELRERLARVEGAQSVRDAQRDGKQESQPATDAAKAATSEKKTEAAPKPKLDDKDDKGQPKFKTYEEYLDARDQWVKDEIKRESQASTKQTAQEQERTRAAEIVRTEQVKRVDKAREKYKDFDAVALAPDLPYKTGSALDHFILRSPHGTDVIYHLAKNRAELERIQGTPILNQDGSVKGFKGGLDAIGQVLELGKIEAKFSAPPPAKKITNAPPPPRVLNGNGAATADEVEQAIKEDDFEGYKARANARDIARRRG